MSLHVGPAPSALGTYRTLRDRGGVLAAASTAVARVLLPDLINTPASSAGARAVFYLDPAGLAVAARQTRLRVRAQVLANATAPAADFTVALYVASATGGAGGVVNVTLGAEVAGSAATITSPAANSMTAAASTDFAAPVAGFYALVVTPSAQTAASADVVVRAELQARHV